MEKIYMDHAATTPIHQQALQAMYPLYEDIYGNPSSIHSFGREARQVIDDARLTMAKSIGANEKEIVFTSGGTESNNLALIGVALANQHKGNHIITTELEHHATLHSAKYLEENGFQITYLPVYENGKIRIEDLKNALSDQTILVSIMHVNNETGVIQPVEEIAKEITEHQTYFHTDAVQALGLLPIDVKEEHIDLLSASSHKINGPKGSGFLYVRDDIQIQPISHGGEQERNRRSGTENVIHIAGFQAAVEIAVNSMESRFKKYQQLKQIFLTTLEDKNVDFTVNGAEETVSTIVNISFPGRNVESLLTNFDLNNIAASSGSACTAGSVEPSHVLQAMFGDDDERTINSIRFSFGLYQTKESVIEAAERIAKIIRR